MSIEHNFFFLKQFYRIRSVPKKRHNSYCMLILTEIGLIYTNCVLAYGKEKKLFIQLFYSMHKVFNSKTILSQFKNHVTTFLYDILSICLQNFIYTLF